MSFHIDDMLRLMPDVQRTFKWVLDIPEIDSVCDSIKDPKEITIRVRSAVIPGRGVELIETNFMGMKQFFAGRPTFPNTLSLTIEETEDQIISKAFYEWNNRIFSTDSKDLLNGGGSKAQFKRWGVNGGIGYSTDIFLKLQKYNSEEQVKKFKFVNAFPSDVGDVSVDYGSSDSVKFNVTLSYDYWELV